MDNNFVWIIHIVKNNSLFSDHHHNTVYTQYHLKLLKSQVGTVFIQSRISFEVCQLVFILSFLNTITLSYARLNVYAHKRSKVIRNKFRVRNELLSSLWNDASV